MIFSNILKVLDLKIWWFVRLTGRRWGIFVTAEIYDNPRDVAQKGDWNIRVNKLQKRFDHIQRNDVISDFR